MDTSKTGSGRRWWTRKQRQLLLAKFHQSQLTQSEFATQKGVGLSTLSKWLRLEREAVPAKVKFQEVQLAKPASRWPVEVVSPQGWIVRLQNGSDVQILPGDGLWVCAKRLEGGRFTWPVSESGQINLRGEEFSALIHGLEVRSKKNWYRR